MVEAGDGIRDGQGSRGIGDVDERQGLRRKFIAGDGAMSFFFQAEDGIRDLVRSRGLGDVYKGRL